MDRRRMLKLTSIAIAGPTSLPAVGEARAKGAGPGLWSVWDKAFGPVASPALPPFVRRIGGAAPARVKLPKHPCATMRNGW